MQTARDTAWGRHKDGGLVADHVSFLSYQFLDNSEMRSYVMRFELARDNKKHIHLAVGLADN